MNEPNITKEQFLYPKNSFRGDFTPETLVFDANLQEFSQKISYLCALESNGKLNQTDAYKQIKQLWKSLECSKKELLDEPQEP